MNHTEDFTGKQIESGPAPLAVLEAFEVVSVIIVILAVVPPLFLAGVPRQRIARRPLSGLSHSGRVVVIEEDRRGRRGRQLRALKTPLKVSGQDRLNRVCLGAAWKTEITFCSR